MKFTSGPVAQYTLLLGLSLFAQGLGCSGGTPTVGGADPTSDIGSPSTPIIGGSAIPPAETGMVVFPVNSGSVPNPVTSQSAQPPVPRDCTTLRCNPGQRCEMDGDAGSACIDNRCEDLKCSEDEKCSPHKLGGQVCAPNSCKTSVDCQASDFCTESGLCKADTCDAQVLTCDGEKTLRCDTFGGKQEQLYTCKSPAYFTSACSDENASTAGCSCEDDWDCPAFTTCEVGVCKGTGKEATCSLPPLPFADTPPAVEIHWGGDSASNDAAHDGSAAKTPAPWPKSSHVQSTPMVANLDDDNGDGLINELDFPEIIFVTYSAGKDNSGVVRAIHGGGPKKGKDMFALCGAVRWDELAPSTTTDDCANGADSVPSRNTVALGDLNRDGSPELVFVTRDRQLVITSNRAEILYISAKNMVEQPSVIPSGGLQYGYLPSIADMDFKGLPEIIVGRQVFVLGTKDGAVVTASSAPADAGFAVTHVFRGGAAAGIHIGTPATTAVPATSSSPAMPAVAAFPSTMGPTSCVGDVHKNVGQELLAGGALYALPAVTPCTGTLPCAGTLTVLWSSVDSMGKVTEDGYCAIADVWGADTKKSPGPANPLDGTPEAVLIADGRLLIHDGATGALLRNVDFKGGAAGGAPNVDDFDGDGFPEISSALSDFMVVVDLQDPSAACPEWPTVLTRATSTTDNPNLPTLKRAGGGSCKSDADCGEGTVCNTQQDVCVCLHNGWKRDSDDDSSKVTSTSVFDFNGDGRSEVLYNDECSFRVYDGPTGSVLYSEISRSRTALENPIVADVDNDGNAEVVTVMNTEQKGRCDDDPGTANPAGPNGLRVWGDPQDSWVSARRVWNQFAYSVTNTTEAAGIPVHPPESWLPYNGRVYNTYRSQPRSAGVAPDLTVSGISLSSPDVACGKLGDKLDITFEITNAGDLRVGPGVQVSFFGIWDGMEAPLLAGGMPLVYTLTNSLEPGRSLIATIRFDAMEQSMASLPGSVRVAVDTGGAAGSKFGAERECIENNNDRTATVEPGEPRPDLAIAVGAATKDCLGRVVTLDVTVTNSGTADARGVSIEIFAGDPAAGGTSTLVVPVEGAIEAGKSVNLKVKIPNFPLNRTITYWGVVDPKDEIAECKEGDNSDPADNSVVCPSTLGT